MAWFRLATGTACAAHADGEIIASRPPPAARGWHLHPELGGLPMLRGGREQAGLGDDGRGHGARRWVAIEMRIPSPFSSLNAIPTDTPS